MENISKEVLESSLDGVYNALWSAYHIEITLPNKCKVDIETTVGVKGINCPVRVKISNGELNIIA